MKRRHVRCRGKVLALIVVVAHHAAMPITASAGAAKFEGKKADLDDLIKRRFFFRQAFEIYGGVGRLLHVRAAGRGGGGGGRTSSTSGGSTS